MDDLYVNIATLFVLRNTNDENDKRIKIIINDTNMNIDKEYGFE